MNQLRDYGLPPDAPQAARDLVNLAVDRVVDVICERTPAALSPSILKGSAMVIEMLAQRVKDGQSSLADAVREVQQRIAERERREGTSRAALAPAPPRKNVVDAEIVEPAAPPPAPEPAPALPRSTPWAPTPASPNSLASRTSEERWGR